MDPSHSSTIRAVYLQYQCHYNIWLCKCICCKPIGFTSNVTIDGHIKVLTFLCPEFTFKHIFHAQKQRDHA